MLVALYEDAAEPHAAKPHAAEPNPAAEPHAAKPNAAEPHAAEPNPATELHVILTRRAAHLRAHSLEVSFPGGAKDPSDSSLWHTALREAHEEIALDPGAVEFIGHLPHFQTVGSRSIIQPQVAFLPGGKPAGLRADPGEVAHIIHVPMSELLRDDVFREELWHFPGRGELAISFFELVGDTVWGATAAMLRQILTLGTGAETGEGTGTGAGTGTETETETGAGTDAKSPVKPSVQPSA